MYCTATTRKSTIMSEGAIQSVPHLPDLSVYTSLGTEVLDYV